MRKQLWTGTGFSVLLMHTCQTPAPDLAMTIDYCLFSCTQNVFQSTAVKLHLNQLPEPHSAGVSEILIITEQACLSLSACTEPEE